MSCVRKTLAFINKDNIKSISTLSSSTTTSAIRQVNNDSNIRMFLSMRGNQTNNNSRRPKLTIQTKHKKITNRNNSKQQLAKKVKKQKLKIIPSRLKKAKQKRSLQSNKGKQQHIRQKRTRLSKKRERSHSQAQLVQNRKKSTMALDRLHNKIKKSKDDSSIQASEAKQHNFEKRDRTTSLMALQALAEKIAIYKAKYGNIETRHSSIVAPPKPHKKQKQRKK